MAPKDGTPNTDEQFVNLVLRYQEKSLSGEELARLNEMLRDDPECRAEFIEICETSQLIRAAQDLPERGPSPTQRSPMRAMPRGSRWLEIIGVAALLLLCVGVGILLLKEDKPQLVEPPPVVAPPTRSVDFIATFADASDDVVWSADHESPHAAGDRLAKGWIRIDAGEVTIAFRSGATVEIEGPAVFGIVSPMRGFLDHGNIKVHAPQEARDFAIGTPAMEVVDLGTKFAMTVDESSGQAKVDVTEGRVDLHLNEPNRKARIRPLLAGQSARVDSAGAFLGVEGKALNEGQSLETDSLLARWRMDDPEDISEVLDASPNQLHGRVVQDRDGETPKTVIVGKDGRGLDLRNRRAVNLCPHVETLGKLRTFTIAAWVRNPQNMIFAISDGSKSSYRVQFERFRNRLVYGWQNGKQWDAIHAVVGKWQPDQWYHVAVTVAGGKVTLFRDGKTLIGPRSTGTQLNTPIQRPVDLKFKTHAYIGVVARFHADQFFEGEIDDVQIYDRALDEDAIRHLCEHPGAVFSDANTLPEDTPQDPTP